MPQADIILSNGSAPTLTAKTNERRPTQPKREEAPKKVQRRYNLDIDVPAQNVFNYVNAAQSVGVLTSPLFGKSTALAGIFESTQPGNRIIYLGFSF